MKALRTLAGTHRHRCARYLYWRFCDLFQWGLCFASDWYCSL